MTESENIHATFEDAIYCAKSWCGEVACEECRLYPLGDIFCQDTSRIMAQAMEELVRYRAIGTVSEFKQLKEKATAKKPIYSDFDENENEEIIPYKAVCPVRGYEFEFGTWNDEQNHHCECGQRLLWD